MALNFHFELSTKTQINNWLENNQFYDWECLYQPSYQRDARERTNIGSNFFSETGPWHRCGLRNIWYSRTAKQDVSLTQILFDGGAYQYWKKKTVGMRKGPSHTLEV